MKTPTYNLNILKLMLICMQHVLQYVMSSCITKTTIQTRMLFMSKEFVVNLYLINCV